MTVFYTDTAAGNGLFFHRDFTRYLKVDERGVRALLNVLALRGVAQAVTLTAIGVKVSRMQMPTMSHARCCALYFPDESWINNLSSLNDPRTRDALYVEQICWNISGAVAEYLFGESDFFGELGLGDLEGVHEHIKAYESLNGVPEGRLLAACTGVVEQLFAYNYEMIEDFSGDMLKQGELEQRKLSHFLWAIKRRKLGNAVLEALKGPAIDDEADRVHRMYFGS